MENFGLKQKENLEKETLTTIVFLLNEYLQDVIKRRIIFLFKANFIV